MDRPSKVRDLVLVLGDQLDARSSAFDGFDKSADAVWMVEVGEEASHVWSHKARIAIFISAMRHFREELRRRGFTVHYREITDADNRGGFGQELQHAVSRLRPERLVVVEPGEWRVREILRQAAEDTGAELQVRPDRHFLCSHAEFAEHAEGRKQLRMEHFYHAMRRRTGILMQDDTPVGERWNLDADNREPFGKDGPGELPRPRSFQPDEITRGVLRAVEKQFPEHPGSLANFDWPVTRRQALAALKDFVQARLGKFGPYEDAMWTGQPYLYHSRLSSSLNLKLIGPRESCEAAVSAYEQGSVPLQSCEGFVRQLIGWREFVRGVYWRSMPEYIDMNELGAQADLPSFYWTAHTDMNCLREVVQQTLDHAFAHHIQRLMVTGLFALLLGVEPRQVHEWYLAVYVDAVEWAELPNVLGMSQFADGGLMASKPYAASGKYIQRMSDYCVGCRYRPDQSVGDEACPFTTLYWEFLMRNEEKLAGNPRMALQLRNSARLAADDRRAIFARGKQIRKMIYEEGS